MNYTPEQIVLKVPKEVNTPDISSLSLKEKKDLANNTNTPPKTLDHLANDKSCGVRWRVAYNPNTPLETLTRLANDKVFW